MPARMKYRTQYVISQYKDKQLRKASIDLIRAVVDLPYFSEARGRRMQFNPMYLRLERLALTEEAASMKQEEDMEANFADILDRRSTTVDKTKED